jgi:hypothetical protein
MCNVQQGNTVGSLTHLQQSVIMDVMLSYDPVETFR